MAKKINQRELKMKTKPIIFKAEMVTAILAGKKTQTRRIIKPQPENNVNFGYSNNMAYWQPRNIKCPYGKIGDKLWVRENFYVLPHIWAQHHNEQPVHYSADVVNKQHIEDYVQKPSIHMPRWASRITLEITNIRVERIQDISEDDAKAEGIRYDVNGFRYEFKHLWDSINKKRGFGWNKNPWVWVIEFKKLNISATKARRHKEEIP